MIAVDLDSPQALAWARATLPATPLRTITSGEMEHWYYRAPPPNTRVQNRVQHRLPDGTKLAVDIRGDYGNIVVAPSVHYSGAVYREAQDWAAVDLETVPVFEPGFLKVRGETEAEAETETEAPAPAPISSEPPQDRPGVQPEMFGLRLHDACSRGEGGAEAIAVLRRMEQGEIYAGAGQRNDLLFQAVRLLAEWFPDATDAQLLEFVSPSVHAAVAEGSKNDLATARDTLARAREKFAARDNLFLRLTRANIAPTQELVRHGVLLPKRLALVTDRGVYCTMRPDGSYGPSEFRKETLKEVLAEPTVLGWAESAQLCVLRFADEKGKNKPVGWQTFVDRHVTVVARERGTFDATMTHVEEQPRGGHVEIDLVRAVAPLRADLSPRYHEQIATWLEKLAGARAPLLLDWLACLLELSRPLPALILTGASQAGKNMLALGCARLWEHRKPTPFETVVGDFNEGLTRCPLLFADEKLPGEGSRRSAIDEQLRELVTAQAHALNAKYKSVLSVDGCVRIIVAQNHDRLPFPGSMNDESERALAERLLDIPARAEARDYLVEIGGPRTTEAWVAGDALARHVLWLRATRVVPQGARLRMDGNGLALVQRSSSTHGIKGDACEWLCAWLMDGGRDKIPERSRAAIRAGNGALEVAAKLWENSPEVWERYIQHGRHELPSGTILGHTLGALSGGNKTQRLLGGARAWFHRINLDRLWQWAESASFGDVEYMRSVLGAPSEEPAVARTVFTYCGAHSWCKPGPCPECEAAPGVFSDPKTLTLSELLGVASAPVVASDLSGVSLDARLPEPAPAPAPRAREKAAPKAKPAPVREERGEAYYTPREVPGWLATINALDETAAVAQFAPHLSAAMVAEPATYARTVAAYRAYCTALRADTELFDAPEKARLAYLDQAPDTILATSRTSKES